MALVLSAILGCYFGPQLSLVFAGQRLMSIEAKCPTCGTEFRRPDGMAGKLEKCPQCRKVMCLPVSVPSSLTDKQNTSAEFLSTIKDSLPSENTPKAAIADGSGINESDSAADSRTASPLEPWLDRHLSANDSTGTVDPDKLPEIPAMGILQTVALHEAVTRSAFSLLLWGLINLTLWFCVSHFRNAVLNYHSHPSLSVYVVVYWDAAFSAMMIVFSIIGAVVKHRAIGIIHGVCILAIGIWNVFGLIITSLVLAWNHITITPEFIGGAMWIGLGLGQVSFGSWAIKRYSFVGRSTTACSRDAEHNAKKLLRALVSFTPELENGRLVFTAVKRFLLASIKHTYCVQLLPERAIFIEKSLTHIFSIEWSDVSRSIEATKGIRIRQPKLISGESVAAYEFTDDQGHLWTGCFRGHSVDVFKAWCHGKLFVAPSLSIIGPVPETDRPNRPMAM
jgi:hypothetical protein